MTKLELPRPKSSQPTWLPSPLEIQTECAKIRATWSELERERRFVGRCDQVDDTESSSPNDRLATPLNASA